jgi:membrane protein YqaA with SNARE-associated domain
MDLGAAFILWATGLVETWGYGGIFLVSFLGNATIFFPIPSFLSVFAVGGVLNPWILGLVAGLGAALGELVGYVLGFGGKKALERKYKKHIKKARHLAHKIGMFPLIVLFAVTPLPDDITGILGGIVHYDLKKFLLASFIGKSILHIGIAWAGFYGSYLVGGGQTLLIIVGLFMFFVVLYNIVGLFFDKKSPIKRSRNK